jgi:CheY-like chemotaxis protein
MFFSLAKKDTLIVEDFAEFARSVRGMLHTMGATQVDIVYNAEDAIDACKARKYNIILSYYNLGPKKDGRKYHSHGDGRS